MLKMQLMNKTDIINSLIRTLITVKLCKLSDRGISKSRTCYYRFSINFNFKKFSKKALDI